MRACNEWSAKRPLGCLATFYAIVLGQFWIAKGITGKWPAGDLTDTLVCFAVMTATCVGPYLWLKRKMGRNPFLKP